MKIGRFEPSSDQHVTRFGSQHLTARALARVTHAATVHCLMLGAGGLIGRHQAVSHQLFLVVAGDGWVRGEAGEEEPISAGQAAYWQAGEWHTTRTEKGLTAIVVEGEDVTCL